jgi:hypothetical protein
MTAVARLQVNGWPLLFGDLLVSAPAARGSQVSLPSVDVIHHADIERGAHRLHQKIAIVADNIVVGWSGKYSAASDVIGELRQRCEQERFSSKKVEEYLRRQRKSIWKEIGLAGFVLDSDANSRTTFGCACQTIQSPVFGDVGYLGTGSDLMQTYFRQDFSVPACPQDPENLAIRAVAYGMAAAANFLTMEQFGCESLDNLFGGGYEIATQSYDEFVKLTDVLYAFWRGTLDPEQTSVTLKSFPFLLLRYEYYGDLLVIRALTLNEKNGIADAREALFAVPPVYRYLTAAERANPPVPRLKSSWLCNYVQILPKRDKMDILSIADFAPESADLQFEESDERLAGITVSEDLYKKIFSSIENRYARAVL